MIIKRLSGILLLIAAAAGTFFSVFALVQIWRYKPALTQSVSENLALIDQTLTTTQDGLTVVGQMVQTVTTDVGSLHTTTLALGQAIHATNPMLDSLALLAGKKLPESISATQSSLVSAQASALLIDNVLGALTSIPFLPVTPYKPDVPLHTALAQVSSSLDEIPPSLKTINTSLVAGQASLSQVEGELAKISVTIQGIGAGMQTAQKVIDQYQAIIEQVKTRLEKTQLAAPGWITGLAWGATIFLAWLLIAQLGLGVQGLEMLGYRLENK